MPTRLKTTKTPKEAATSQPPGKARRAEKGKAPEKKAPARKGATVDLGSLGDVKYPKEGPEREKFLKQLTSLHDRMVQKRETWKTDREQAKTSKGEYDQALDKLHTFIRVNTHESDLPLVHQMEHDWRRLEAGDIPEELGDAFDPGNE
jgi:hypothetical protein